MATHSTSPISTYIPHDSPAPPSPTVHGVQSVWVDARANTSVGPSSAQMTSSYLPVDATQGVIVPVTPVASSLPCNRSSNPRMSRTANTGRSQVALLPVVTVNSLTQAWNTRHRQGKYSGRIEGDQDGTGAQHPCACGECAHVNEQGADL